MSRENGDGSRRHRPRVVVVGAGFGGLAVVRGLATSPVDVTLVDRNNFHTFQPLLYQVATAGLNAADIAYAVRGIVRGLPNVEVRRATVTAVDWAGRRVELDDGDHHLPFDHLVVAAGATAEFFGVDGAAEHSLPLYTLDDATALRNHVLSRFEAVAADPALVDDGALTFVVVGGGPTGVEVAGALTELFGVLRRDFRRVDLDAARVVLVEVLDELLAPFRPASRQDALRELRRRGVDVRLGTAVEAVTPTLVRLAGGEELPAHTLIWAAGVRANPLADVLAVETGRGGRVVVTPDLRIPSHPEAFAIGDVAAIADGHGGHLPGVAQVAMQSGAHAAAEIRRSLAGEPPRPFRYRDKGSMATIGRRAAVAELPLGIRLSGTLGWGAWLVLHLVQLMGFRNRLSVLVNWMWAYVAWDRGPRLIFGARGQPARRP